MTSGFKEAQMLKLSFSMLSVLTLICIQVCVQAVWANRCQGVFTNTSSWIDAKVNAIHSSESLAQFLSETGGFGPANYEHIQKLATILYGEVDVQRLANALLLNHRHTAKDAVLLASFAVYRGDLTNAKQLMRYFPKSVDKETFFRWTNAKTTLQ